MTILTHAFKNGNYAILQKQGKQSVIQILDSAGEVLITRCKSISRAKVPIKTDAPTRTAIGFIPQELKSHTYDNTRRQIGFMLPGQQPKEYLTDIGRNTHITISKVDFDTNFNIANISNIQRRYSDHGRLLDVVQIGDSCESRISELIQNQEKILKKTQRNKKVYLNAYESIISKLKNLLQEFKNSIRQSRTKIKEAKKELKNSAEIKENLEIRLSMWSDYSKKIEANAERSAIEEFGLTVSKRYEAEIQKELDAINNLEHLIKEEKNSINNHHKLIKLIQEKINKYSKLFERVKKYHSNIDFETRKNLCLLQEKINSIISMQNKPI